MPIRTERHRIGGTDSRYLDADERAVRRRCDGQLRSSVAGIHDLDEPDHRVKLHHGFHRRSGKSLARLPIAHRAPPWFSTINYSCLRIVKFRKINSQYRIYIRYFEAAGSLGFPEGCLSCAKCLRLSETDLFITAVKQGLIGVNIFIVIWIIGVQLAARHLLG